MSGLRIINFIFGAALALVARPAEANSGVSSAFLSRDGLPHSMISTDLLSELERVVGKDHRLATERRVARLEGALKPMFDSMPKNGEGNLHAMSVRYLLHRLFVQRHGWFVNGLAAAGESWNSSSPAQVFEKHAGEDMRDVFHNKLEEAGFSLHQVAVFAATLEALVHTESIERLEAAYRITGISAKDQLIGEHNQLTDAYVTEAADMYMMMYVLNMNHSIVSADEMQEAKENIMEIYPTWPDTQVFVAGVRESVLADVESKDRTTWSTTLKVLEEVGERYGRWQDKECHHLKDELVKMDEDGNGRVPLERFYEKAMTNSSWQFLESVPYLRQLGALDDTDPHRLSVIIPNYINSPSNCVASSKFYAVCCIDECESLLGSLETHIGMPDAPPALITQLVAGLKSTTVSAPRQLDAALLQRLEEIATHHAGTVPLHGRLFAQWMHHAYPRECPYPHVAGTTNPLGAEEFYASTGHEVEATHEEIRELMHKTSRLNAEAPATEQQALPWSAEEELFVHRPKQSPSAFSMLSGFIAKGGLLVAALASILAMMSKVNGTGAKGMVMGCKDNHKYYV